MAKHNFVAEVYNLLSKFQSMQDLENNHWINFEKYF